MIEFAIEALPPIWPDIMRLALAHWSETEAYRHGQKFNPDAARYFAFNEIVNDGVPFYTMFTARDEGRLVGYAGCYITRSMHTQKLLCSEDTYFLLPEYRKGRNAVMFYKFMENFCEQHGVEEMGMTAKKVNSVGRILEYLGFVQESSNYWKPLKKRLADAA